MKLLGIALLVLLAACTQYASPESPAENLPSSVIEKYEELEPRYNESVGTTIRSCVNEEETIYTVAGSGGYSGATYYYTAEGVLIGTHQWTDVIDQDTPQPPVDTDEYNCTTIIG